MTKNQGQDVKRNHRRDLIRRQNGQKKPSKESLEAIATLHRSQEDAAFSGDPNEKAALWTTMNKMRDQHKCVYRGCGKPASHHVDVIYVDGSAIAPDGTLDPEAGIVADDRLPYCEDCYELVCMVSPVVIRVDGDQTYMWRQATYAQLGIFSENCVCDVAGDHGLEPDRW